MAIVVNLYVMMAKRKMSLNELSEKVGLTLSNLSILKTGKAKAIRFTTLEAICEVLDYQPGVILAFEVDEYSSILNWFLTRKNSIKRPSQLMAFYFLRMFKYWP